MTEGKLNKLKIMRENLDRNMKCEKEMNDHIISVALVCMHDKYNIKQLTELDGNCFFRSLEILGLCNDHVKLRKCIASIFFTFKTYKGFFPAMENETLESLFNNSNEVENVIISSHDSNTGEATREKVKYDYDTMCKDLSNEGSWERLPTQLIIMVISKILRVKFIIYTSGTLQKTEIFESSMRMFEGEKNIVKAEETDLEKNSRVIALGHMKQIHYVPLEKMKNTDTDIKNTTISIPTYVVIQNKIKEIDKIIENLEKEINDRKEKIEK
jgi:hypothetical protein